jgi:NAD-dependent deacetylase
MEIELTEELAERVATAERVVALTGAGVSAESGLATFRGEEGLWRRFRPEELATPEAFAADPETVWQWYGWRFERVAAAEPNPGHRALVRFAALFPSFILVTQNVDDLHRRAGSADVIELHGTIMRARCTRCERSEPMAAALARSPAAPPACPCGGTLRPGVVWFGEPLPAAALARATAAAAAADLFVSAGTSARVFPAAGLIERARRGGACVIEVNPEATAFSSLAHLRLAAPAGEALPALADACARCRSGAR